MASIVQALNKEWATVADSPTARRALMRWTARNPILGQATTLNDLVDTRHDPDWGHQAHRALAAEAATDQLAARTLLQSLIGGLTHLSRKVGGGDPDSTGQLVSLAWTRIRTYPQCRCGPVAANVLLDVRKAYLLERRETGGDFPEKFDRLDESRSPEQLVCDRDVLDQLKAARDRGVVTGDALATVIRTRMGGETLAEVSADRGVTLSKAWRQRTQAENQLRHLPLAA